MSQKDQRVSDTPAFELDTDLESADWAKQSWDLPPYKSREFLAQFTDLALFRTWPVYRHAVDSGRILGDEWIADYNVKVAVHRKNTQKSPDTFAKVELLAFDFLSRLCSAPIQDAIEKAHKHGESSAKVQEAIRPVAEALQFESEKKNLFANLGVPALRPDYFRKVEGIILEVERGKTIANNMDLLDLWKCHICTQADYLFLLVPQKRQTANGGHGYPFKHVCKRLGTFFVPGNHVNVEAVFVFGY